MPVKQKSNLAMFLIPSAVGILIFMIPVKFQGTWTILVKILADFISGHLGTLLPLLCVAILTISAVMAAAALLGASFIRNRPLLKECFTCAPVWVIVRCVGCVFAWLTLLGAGSGNPVLSAIAGPDQGGVALDLIVGLVIIFAIASFLLPLLLDFGLLEFVGALLTKFMRPLFRVPGRAMAETLPPGFSTSRQYGLSLAMDRVREHRGLGEFLSSGMKNCVSMWFGVLPTVMCIGTLALILANYTPIFQWLGVPFLPLLQALGVPDAAAASTTMIVGFTDMFTPSVLIAAAGVSAQTRFIVAVISVTQVLFLDEVGGAHPGLQAAGEPAGALYHLPGADHHQPPHRLPGVPPSLLTQNTASLREAVCGWVSLFIRPARCRRGRSTPGPGSR